MQYNKPLLLKSYWERNAGVPPLTAFNNVLIQPESTLNFTTFNQQPKHSLSP